MTTGAALAWEVRDPQSNALIEDGILLIDVLLEERIREPAEVSKYPAEKGPSRADNHRPENPVISLSCLFLGHPTLKTVGGVKSQAQIDASNGTGDTEAFDLLKRLKNESVFLTFTTLKHQYDNLLIKDLDRVADKGTGEDVLQIQIVLEQQQLVTLQTVQVKKNKPPTGNSVCQGRQDNGPKTAEAVPPEKKKTIFSQGKDGAVKWVNGIFGK